MRVSQRLLSASIPNTIVLGALCFSAGCSAPKPELLLPTERDQAVYEDKGAIKTRKDLKFRMAVCVDKEDYKKHPSVGQAIEAQMAQAVSKFSFFEFVERERVSELAAERLFSGNADDASSLLKEADCLLSVKLNVGQTRFAKQMQNPYEHLVDQYYVPPAQTGKKKNDALAMAIARSEAEQRAKTAAGTHPVYYWRLEIKPDFRLYEVDSRRVALVKSYRSEVVVSAPDQAEKAVMDEMGKHVATFSRLLTSRYAPTARVLETRGDGEVALVSMGTNSGLEPGMSVEFFEYADYSNLVADSTRQARLVGRGEVLTDLTPTTAWIWVKDYDKVWIKRGHYVRVPEERGAPENNDRRARRRFLRVNPQ